MGGYSQDTDAKGPVGWVKRRGATPPQRYYALLHEKDFFDSKAQLSADLALRENPSERISRIGFRFDPAQLGPIVISSRPERDPHMSLITSDFREVWRTFLERPARPRI